MQEGSDKDDYFRRVEEHFGRRRGGPLLLSPRDWKLVDEWYRAGIPLPLVLRGINRAFDRFQGTGPRPDRINSLRYCRQHVETVWRESAVGRAAAAVADGETTAATHLRHAAAACRGRADATGGPAAEPLRRAAAALDRLVRRIEDDDIDARGIDRAARAIEEELVDALQSEPTDAAASARGLGLPAFSPYEL